MSFREIAIQFKIGKTSSKCCNLWGANFFGEKVYNVSNERTNKSFRRSTKSSNTGFKICGASGVYVIGSLLNKKAMPITPSLN